MYKDAQVSEQLQPGIEEHQADHSHAEVYEKDIDAPMILIVGLVFAVVLFLSIFFLQGYFYRVQHQEQEAKLIEQRPQQLLATQADQQEKLNSYSWVDRAQGIVSLPINQAMELELKRLQAGPAPAAPAARAAAPNDPGTQN
jgi:hypothetical protein